MGRNIYVLIEGNAIECYSNLTKLIRNAPKTTYYPIYRALLKLNRVERNGYVISKTKLK
jgi:hypothetical protein